MNIDFNVIIIKEDLMGLKCYMAFNLIIIRYFQINYYYHHYYFLQTNISKQIHPIFAVITKMTY